MKTYGVSEILPRWPKMPRFQHLFQEDNGANKNTAEKAAAVSIKAKVAEAGSPEEIHQIVQGIVRSLASTGTLY
jgi:hypothetical protein